MIGKVNNAYWKGINCWLKKNLSFKLPCHNGFTWNWNCFFQWRRKIENRKVL